MLASTKNSKQRMASARIHQLFYKRFKFHQHPYLMQVAKVGAIPLLHEIANVWVDELATTTRHKFRGEYWGTYILIAVVHFVTERHHKVLCWKYVIGRIGGDSDEWDAEHRWRVWTDLSGGASGSGGSVSSLVVGDDRHRSSYQTENPR